MSFGETIGPRLEVLSKGRVARTVTLRAATILIGRRNGVDIRYEDTRVSRDHATIERREGGGYVLRDTSSHQATYLNDRQLERNQPVLLADGDRIRIADHELVFRAAPTVIADDRHEGASTILQTVADFGTIRLSRQSPRPADAFRAVLDLNRALGGGGSLDEILLRALDILMDLFSQTACGLIATAKSDGTLPVRAIRQRGGPPPKLTLSRSILRRVIDNREAVLIQDVDTDDRFGGVMSVAALFRSALCVPLLGHDGQPVGMVQLGGRPGIRDDYSAEDLDLLIALAVPLGVAVENDRLISERATLNIASEIQRFLMRSDSPEIPGYSFWRCYEPAQEVGGDLYSYVRVGPDDPRWVISVGDVTGKGIPGALISVAINPEIRQAVATGAPPSEIIRRVNQRVCEIGFETHFVTLIVARLDPVQHRVTIASAGHERPFLRRASGEVELLELRGKGTWLGVRPTSEYAETELTLEPGDLLLFYSDGLPDAHNREGKRLGYEPLEKALATAPPGVVAAGEALVKVVDEHARGRSAFDDLTIVAFARDPA
ncbi:MAG: SpoIIE family protein phosphatase [Isosphaeraceae bacterium]